MGCNDCNSDEGTSGFGTESLKKETFEASMYPSYASNKSGNCPSKKGHFYDLTLEDFIVPNIGSETYIKVCDGSLWKVGQFIGIAMSGNKMAAFKITGIGTGKLKVLNGCDKSGDNGIVDNPEVGTEIKKGSVFYAIPPTGCESGFAARLIQALELYGVESVINMLAEEDDICFTSVKDISEDEEVHMFGGTMPDCECAPDEGWSSCLRKLKKIFTGQGGRTLCMNDAATVSSEPVNGVPKRFALFDENGCIKKGPTPAELRSCEDNTVVTKDTPVESVIVCKDGVYSAFVPLEENLVITSKKYEIPVDEGGGFEYKWLFQSSTNDYAILKHTGSSGTSGGAATLGDWREKTLNVIAQQSAGFITLSGNKFTILKSGVFEIDWDCVFVNTADTQTRLDNSLDAAEQYLGTNPYPLSGNGTTSSGFAVVTVPSGETRQFNLMYRVGFTGTQGDAIPWGVPVWSVLKIRRIA
jgi:hypothetical protein